MRRQMITPLKLLTTSRTSKPLLPRMPSQMGFQMGRLFVNFTAAGEVADVGSEFEGDGSVLAGGGEVLAVGAVAVYFFGFLGFFDFLGSVGSFGWGFSFG